MIRVHHVAATCCLAAGAAGAVVARASHSNVPRDAGSPRENANARIRAVATHGAGGQPCQGVRDTGGDAREAPDAYATRNQGWNEVVIHSTVCSMRRPTMARRAGR
jgi:hypothetical protein